jgi:hypothetical protein
MGTAAKAAITQDAQDLVELLKSLDHSAPSATEEYALLTGEEIFAASRETSRQFNGIVLAKAIVIVQTRTRCSNLTTLAKQLELGRVTLYRYVTGRPCNDTVFRRMLRDLAILLEDSHEKRAPCK